MLGVIGRLVRPLTLIPVANFGFIIKNSQEQRQLTRSIVLAQSPKQLKQLITLHSANINQFHLTALLKKLTHLSDTQPQLCSLIYQHVSQFLEANRKPNMVNSSALALIISYSGTMKYDKVNDLIRKVDVNGMFRFLKPREAFIAFKGLLQLGLIDAFFKDLNSILDPILKEQYRISIVISLWNELIQQNKIDEKLNKTLIQKIDKLPMSSQVIDLCQLIDIFIAQHTAFPEPSRSQLNDRLLADIRKFLYRSRYMAKQFCFLLNKIKKFCKVAAISLDDQQIQNIEMIYLGISEGEKFDLRFLANAYHDYCMLVPVSQPRLYEVTIQNFAQKLESLRREGQDWLPVGELLTRIHITRQWLLKSENSRQTSTIRDRDEKIIQIVKNIRNLLFKTNLMRGLNVQVYLSIMKGLLEHKKDFKQFVWTEQQKQIAAGQVLKFQKLTQEQYLEIQRQVLTRLQPLSVQIKQKIKNFAWDQFPELKKSGNHT